MNPLYIEYYPHTNREMYKIDLPWTKYARETRVLCPASKDIKHAKRLARRVIMKHLISALDEHIGSVSQDHRAW
jgi:hypothetical protein